MRHFIVALPQGRSYREAAEAFRKHLLTLGHSPHGAKTKYHVLLEFFCRLECQGHSQIETIQAKDLGDYYEYLKKRPNKKTGAPLGLKTCYSALRAIQLFFTHLQSEGRLIKNPASAIRVPYPKQDQESKRVTLSQEEIKELYRFTVNQQERAILGLAYGCGLRCGELVAVNMGDIRFRERILIVPKGKGGKRRVVPLSLGVLDDLTGYLFKERPALTKGRYHLPGENALMLNQVGRRMQKWTFNHRLKEIIKRTENKTLIEKQITLHHLRHSIATHLLERGMPVEQVRTFLGHSQLETTQIYTHITRKHLKSLKRQEWN